MDEPRFVELTEQATAGLRGDAELRLEVGAELTAHLEDTAHQLQATGASAEESVTEAVRAFGSPLELADALLAANRRRMRMRALARLWLGALIVPLAIVAALWVGYGRLERMRNAEFTNDDTISGAGLPSQLPELPGFATRYSRALQQSQRNPLFQLESKPENAKRIRAYWASHRHDPDSYIYYANYASCISENDPNFERDMRLGEQVDPSNALYHYRLAEYYLGKGIRSREEQKYGKESDKKDILLNRTMLARGIAEYLLAINKPTCSGYHVALKQKQLALLPPPEFTEDYLQRLAVSVDVSFPEYTRYHAIARRIAGCTRVLAQEGRREEAETLIESWRPLARQMLQQPETLIQVFALRKLADIIAKNGTKVYNQWGMTTEANRTQTDLERFDACYSPQRKYTSSSEKTYIAQHSSQLTSILFPVFGDVLPNVTALAPLRNHEYIVLEEGTINLLLIALSATMLLALGQWWLWRYIVRQQATPMLLLPDGQHLLRTLGLGVLVPLAVYFAWTRLPLIGGREYGLWYIWPLATLEFLALFLTLLYLPAHLSRKQVRARCRPFNLPIPEMRRERRLDWISFFSTVLLLLVLVVTPVGVVGLNQHNRAVMTNEALAEYLSLLPLLALVATGAYLVINLFLLRAKRHFALYYGTVARSLMPVYALSIILIAGLAQPYLLSSERHWLRADTLLFNQAEVYTRAENEAIARYRSALLEALER